MNTETAEAFDKLTAAIAQEREAHDALVEELKNENRKLAARIRELEGALRGAIDHMTTCGTALRVGALSNASAVVYLCGGQGAIGAAEEARRVLGKGGKP